jgi:hypothetical protein
VADEGCQYCNCKEEKESTHPVTRYATLVNEDHLALGENGRTSETMFLLVLLLCRRLAIGCWRLSRRGSRGGCGGRFVGRGRRGGMQVREVGSFDEFKESPARRSPSIMFRIEKKGE